MTKNIAVDGCTLQFQSGGNGTITINPGQASTKVKADGKGVYKTLKFSISGYTGQAITVPGSGSGNGEITASSQHVKVEGNAVFLEGDVSASITINGQATSGTSTVPAQADEIVKITNAGQSKVKGA
jgi:uncharacterized Zn-binding protein involved in type VI secretion